MLSLFAFASLYAHSASAHLTPGPEGTWCDLDLNNPQREASKEECRAYADENNFVFEDIYDDPVSNTAQGYVNNPFERNPIPGCQLTAQNKVLWVSGLFNEYLPDRFVLKSTPMSGACTSGVGCANVVRQLCAPRPTVPEKYTTTTPQDLDYDQFKDSIPESFGVQVISVNMPESYANMDFSSQFQAILTQKPCSVTGSNGLFDLAKLQSGIRDANALNARCSAFLLDRDDLAQAMKTVDPQGEGNLDEPAVGHYTMGPNPYNKNNPHHGKRRVTVKAYPLTAHSFQMGNYHIYLNNKVNHHKQWKSSGMDANDWYSGRNYAPYALQLGGASSSSSPSPSGPQSASQDALIEKAKAEHPDVPADCWTAGDDGEVLCTDGDADYTYTSGCF